MNLKLIGKFRANKQVENFMSWTENFPRISMLYFPRTHIKWENFHVVADSMTLWCNCFFYMEISYVVEMESMRRFCNTFLFGKYDFAIFHWFPRMTQPKFNELSDHTKIFCGNSWVLIEKFSEKRNGKYSVLLLGILVAQFWRL